VEAVCGKRKAESRKQKAVAKNTHEAGVLLTKILLYVITEFYNTVYNRVTGERRE
jgi:hypothetical protein